ncbi:glycosyltransferase [Brytella acorum]|uniref:Glycosyltransferase n=1 Tax=Brytella acorum TaxID=2959299 RepID=A0AA35VAY3_9PROT|nr:glycosyltransferase [Brytella acorum]MDF3624602.1 glycosyltransferase [Brytella acorum]CAI9120958.1 glycosyltransferase [Brytella acorum]
MNAERSKSEKPRPVFAGYGHEVTERDRLEWQKWMDARAQDAFARGQAAISSGRTRDAAFWLDRAARMARHNPNVLFSLALAQLGLERWADLLATADQLLARFRFREALCLRVVALIRLRRFIEADATLGEALSGFAPTAEMAALATEIASMLDHAGWCGASNTGEVRGGAQAPVRWRLDGRGRWSTVPCFPFTLPDRWIRAERLEVRLGNTPLLGSPIDLTMLRRSEGFIRPVGNAWVGQLWHPAEPEFLPRLRILGSDGGRDLLLSTFASEVDNDVPVARPRQIVLKEEDLPRGIVRVLDTYGRELSGSPLEPLTLQLLNGAPAHGLPPDWRPRPVTSPSKVSPDIRRRSPGCLVVIPVYRDFQSLRLCLESVLRTTGQDTEILVVDDASPEPIVVDYLDRLALAGNITLCRHERNAGFPSAANSGLRRADGRDVVLLNSDTIVAPGWLERLQAALDRAPDVGTATPFSNDASILSYPSASEKNPIPNLKETEQLDRFCAAQPEGEMIDLPTANGFCMAIRGDCLAQTGLLREDLFAQGYGEENEFCLRAASCGWRHIAAPRVFVTHSGSSSFGSARKALMSRNLEILNALYPGYDELVRDFIVRDPLFPFRRALDIARLDTKRGAKNTRVMILHDSGGGVARVVSERCAAFEKDGQFVLSLRPHQHGVRVSVAGGVFTNLVFRLPDEWAIFLAILRRMRVLAIEWHHLVGHAPQMRRLHAELGVPYDIFVHDYVWFCERVSLLNGERRYCGEPAIEGCERCVAENGSYLGEDIAPSALVLRSKYELRNAGIVRVPSHDTGRRLARHFPDIAAVVTPLEDDRRWDDSGRSIRMREGRTNWLGSRGGRRRIGFVGGIGAEKGYDVVRGLAEDAAARDLPLDYVLIGHTPDDEALFRTGRVLVTGEYREDEVERLIHEADLDFGFIPSITPETWCFTLGVIWRAGLPAVVFDLGAQAERVRQTGFGWTVPLGLPIETLSHVLLRLQ